MISDVLRKVFALVRRIFTPFNRPLFSILAQGPVSPSRRLSVFQRHLLTNLAVGLGIALLLHQLHHGSFLTQIDDMAMDWAMQMHRGTVPAGDPRPVAFIDVDEASYLAWGEPLLTPRDKLATLVEHAISGGAALIFIDIDLTRPTPGDLALKRVLARYADNDNGVAVDLPPIILVSVVRARLPGTTGALPMERVSPFDALVDAASGLHWATAVFELEEDSKVRRWRLWEAACDVDGKPVVRPSVQLQSKALLDADAAQRQQLEQALAALTPSACDPETGDAQGGGTPGAHHPEAMLVQLGGDNISLMPHQSERRILYHIPWQLRPGESRPLVGLDGAQTPLLSVRSALVIADAEQAAYPNWLRDHLVIIGTSYLESRDLYQTPLGLMPGALIVANAVESMDLHGELRTPSLIETLLIESVLIVVMSILFARFHSFFGTILSGTVVIAALLPLSLWLFDAGYWLSFAIPLVAVLIHRMAAELEQILVTHDATEG